MNIEAVQSLGWVVVNGDFVPASEACISPFDRGFLFADAIYEVTTVVSSTLIDFDPHLARLRRSARAIGLALPWEDHDLQTLHKDLVSRNQLDEGYVYLQVSRGAGLRDFAIDEHMTPTLFMFSQARSVMQTSDAQNGIKVITVPETRWAHRDIKTAALLPASLAKQKAKQAGAQDAWFVEDGRITEGSSNNAFIVTKQREILTRDLGQHVLPGITRAAIIRLAEEQGYQVIERGFTVIEAESATEAFFTSATAFAIPVVEINGHQLSSGKPGPVFQAIRAAYLDHVRSQIP